MSVEPEIECRPEGEFCQEIGIPAETCEGGLGAARPTTNIASQYTTADKPTVTASQEASSSTPHTRTLPRHTECRPDHPTEKASSLLSIIITIDAKWNVKIQGRKDVAVHTANSDVNGAAMVPSRCACSCHQELTMNSEDDIRYFSSGSWLHVSSSDYTDTSRSTISEAQYNRMCAANANSPSIAHATRLSTHL